MALHSSSQRATGQKAAITTAAYGVKLYYGGDAADGTGSYAVRNDLDQRASGSGAAATSFTVGSASAFTGNFDNAVSSTLVGPGSYLSFANDSYRYRVVAMTSTGAAANQVTLDRLPPGAVAGSVFGVAKITPCIDFQAAKAGVIVPQGFVLGASAVVNASAQALQVIAWAD